MTSTDIALPLLKPPSHVKRRWIVLFTVQGIIILHVVLWMLSKKYGWFGGATLTPIEPSEGMEFIKKGYINAGLIFFLIALISTLIFGRWFCGWACHIVLLQDGCFWLLRKMHIRPKPFRARLLMWFPFALGAYMFLWPAFYRFAIAPFTRPELAFPEITTHLTTTTFWSSFPPVVVAIPYLLICGFATVYVLGSKGFCTYGCPYGGFFKPIDNASPMRVRVNENCQQCGQCTAACTSNVRVHEEVHIYKMVIDSGCMKTMSCIDACPNDALSIGFGSTAIGQRQTPKKYDLSVKEEFGIALFFLFGFFAFRGIYASVPMLMAVGLSLVVTWLIWKAFSMLTKPNVSFHKTQLKFHGKITTRGKLYLVISFVLLLITLQSGAVSGLHSAGDYSITKGYFPEAMGYYKLAGPIDEGGLGFASNPNMDTSLAKLYEYQGEYELSEKLLIRVVDRVSGNENAVMMLGQVMQFNHSFQHINQFYESSLESHPEWKFVWEDYVAWLKRGGAAQAAINVSTNAITFNPKTNRLLVQHALVQMQFGDATIAVKIFEQLTVKKPQDPNNWFLLSKAQNAAGDLEGSQASFERGSKLQNYP